MPQSLGSSNSVIRHQIQAERVQWNHATLGFPPQIGFIKALGRDLEIPGITTDMVQSNFPDSLNQPLGRLTNYAKEFNQLKLNLIIFQLK